MIDAVFLKLHGEQPDITGKLGNVRATSGQDGQMLISGRLGNLRVGQSESGITIAGSLPKFFAGTNGIAFTRQNTERAVERISDHLGLDIRPSRLYSLEVACNISLKRPVSQYLSRLESLRACKRMAVAGQSVAFLGRMKAMKCYDKQAELTDHRLEIPDIFEITKNVLRIELVIQRRLALFFHRKEVRASDLYEPAFYVKAIEAWKRHWQNIRKSRQIDFNPEAISDVRSFEQQLAAIGLKAIGHEQIQQAIESRKPDISRVALTRIRMKARELAECPDFTEQDDLIAELDAKVKQASMYFR